MTSRNRSVFLLLVLLYSAQTIAQDQNTIIGSPLNNRIQSQGAYYDYSNPEAINIKVNIWGNVRFPGQYLVPQKLNVIELITLAGGPTNDARLEEIRLYRMQQDSTYQTIALDYNNVLWGQDDISINKVMGIEPGDVLVFPGEPRWYLRDYLSLGFSTLSALISVTLLIYQITK